MERGLLEHARGEQLIATGRMTLALFTVVVAYLDPGVSGSRGLLLPIAAGFAAYAVLAGAAAWRTSTLVVRGRLVLHIVDFLLFSTFIQLTHASVSPFFIFFLFSLLSALVRWGVKGMLITAGAAIATYVGLATIDSRIRSDPGYLIMRVTSLSVATLLLTYVGAYHERIRSELTKLATWPALASDQTEPMVRETLLLARDLIGAPRALLVWEEEEEPWTTTAMLDRGEFQLTQEEPGFLDRIVSSAAREGSFLERKGRDATTLSLSGGESGRSLEPMLTAEGETRFGAEVILSAPVLGQTIRGRIFFFDGDDLQTNDIAVVDIVARLVAARLDQLNTAARAHHAAVTQERLRVARDLHDGFLQSLTAASLQLELINRLIDTDPAAARMRMRNVQQLIATDQAELRTLISGLRPATRSFRPVLGLRLDELAERIRRQWDIAVTITMEPSSIDLPEDVASEIYNIVCEATVNAAKHAQATRIAVELYMKEEDIFMIVTDDGKGFPFFGTYTLQELSTERRGPVTLKERVASLQGDMVLSSTPRGASVRIRISRDERLRTPANLRGDANPDRSG